MSETKTTHEVLVEARNLYAEVGKAGLDYVLSRDDRAHCADTAIDSVCSVPEPAEAAFAKAVGLSQQDNYTLIWSWHDEDERTKEEVLAAFDRAIAQTAPTPDLSFLEDRDGFLDRPDICATSPTEPIKKAGSRP
jgi:hypothetical protein